MKGIISALATLGAFTLLAVPLAWAGTPVTVRMPTCLAGGGERTVPVGSQVTIASAWASKSKGAVMRLVDATDVTVAIDGVAVPNANSYFTPIERIDSTLVAGPDEIWRAEWEYDTGITLENAGDQIVVYYSWVLDRRIRDSGSPESGGAFIGPGEVFGSNICTITAG